MAAEPTIEQLQSSERYWAMYRNSIAEVAAKGNENTLDATVDSAIIARATTYLHPLLLDHEIHGLWYTFIEGAKNFTSDNPKQDRLAYYVLYLRGIGTVTSNPQETVVTHRTSSGQEVWSDLPYLTEDLEQACADNSMSAAHRTNLHSFIARLASAGVCGDVLTGFALSLFRDAFETPSADTNVPLQDLLQAVSSWAEYAPHKLASVIKRSVGDELSPKATALGKLCEDGGVESGGWNVSRWAFWERQVKAITQSDQKELALEASTLLTMMADIGNGNKLTPDWTMVE